MHRLNILGPLEPLVEDLLLAAVLDPDETRPELAERSIGRHQRTAHPAGVGEDLPPPYVGRHLRRVLAVECVECYCLSEGRWQGWGAYRVDEPDTDDLPELAFYCPGCRQEQFGNQAPADV